MCQWWVAKRQHRLEAALTSRALILNMKRRQWVRRLPTGAAAGQERRIQLWCTTEREKWGGWKQNGIWKRICQLASLSARLNRTDSFSLSLTRSVCFSFPLSLSLSFCLLPSLPPKRCRLVVSLPFSLLLARSLLTSPHTQYFARCCWLGLLFCALIGQLDGLEPALIICLWESWSTEGVLSTEVHFSRMFFFSGISSSCCLNWNNNSAISAAEQLYNTKLSF